MKAEHEIPVKDLSDISLSVRIRVYKRLVWRLAIGRALIRAAAKVMGCSASITVDESAIRDWPEDFEHDNGQYMHSCVDCGSKFVGHKYRITCRACQIADGCCGEPKQCWASCGLLGKSEKPVRIAKETLDE